MQFSIALALALCVLATGVSAFPVGKSDLTKLLNDGGAYDIALPERRGEEEELTKLYHDIGAYSLVQPEKRDEDDDLTNLYNDEGYYGLAEPERGQS